MKLNTNKIIKAFLLIIVCVITLSRCGNNTRGNNGKIVYVETGKLMNSCNDVIETKQKYEHQTKQLADEIDSILK